MKSAFDIPNIINSKNGYVLDLSPDRLTSALAAECFSLTDSTLHSDYAGRAILSDPTSTIAMVLNDQVSGTEVRPFMSMLFSKSGKRTANTAIAARTCDIGFYPLVANTCNSANTSFETKFKCIEGYPSGIVEWHYVRDYDGKVRAIDVLSFTRNDVLYIIADGQNINDLKIAMEWVGWDSGQPDKHDVSAGYEKLNGQGVIWVEEHNSDWFAALSCTNMNEYQVDSSQFTPIYGLDETKTSVSHSSCFVGLGTNGLGDRGSVVFSIALGRTKLEAEGKAVAGISNWQSKYTEAENMWREQFSGLERQWFAPEIIKAKGYFALTQILIMSVGGYMAAGLPNWPYNWLRDTAWVIHALIPIKPALAAKYLSWFEGKNMITVNDFDIDGTGEYNYNNTDNAAVFLAAAGKYFRHTTRLKERTIEVKCLLKQSSMSALAAAQRALNTLFNPHRGECEVRFDDEYFYIYKGRFRTKTVIETAGCAEIFHLQFTCSKSFIYGPKQYYSTQSTARLLNRGSQKTPLKMTIRGPAAFPVISLANKRIKINTTLRNSNDLFNIDSENIEIALNGAPAAHLAEGA